MSRKKEKNPNSKSNNRYTNISIPSGLAEEIDRFIEEHKGLGFSSRAEFVKSAIREKIAHYQAKRS